LADRRGFGGTANGGLLATLATAISITAAAIAVAATSLAESGLALFSSRLFE